VTTRMRQTAFDFITDRPLPPYRKTPRTDKVYLAFKPRLLDAIWIDERMEPIGRKFSGDLSRVDPSRLHLTLYGIGWRQGLPPGFADEIDRHMNGICGAPIPIWFDRMSRFGGDSIVLRGGPYGPINILRQLMIQRLAPLWWIARKQGKSIQPHMTAFHSKLSFPDLAIEPICWTATEIVLVHSFHGHSILRRWPLTGPADIYDRLMADARMPDLFDERLSRSDHA